jgi:dTDP-4-amino-4,6-dideoxygalactose transaminase
VDIDPATFNLDANLLASKITSRTKAIIPVHLFGQAAEMDTIITLAQGHGLILIEDAAQAIGAEFKGRRAGSFGQYGCLSFFPSKNLGAAGDGGMVVTGDAERAEKLLCLRAHGSKPKYHHRLIGGNFRLDTLQAAIVSAKLTHLDSWTAARQKNADRYDRLLRDSGLPLVDSRSDISRVANDSTARWLVLPLRSTDRHIFNQYIVRVPQRDRMRASLQARDISTEVYYPVPMHLQECFAYLSHSSGDFPESERAALQSLALPIFPELSEEQARYVVQCIKDFFSGRS